MGEEDWGSGEVEEEEEQQEEAQQEEAAQVEPEQEGGHDVQSEESVVDVEVEEMNRVFEDQAQEAQAQQAATQAEQQQQDQEMAVDAESLGEAEHDAVRQAARRVREHLQSLDVLQQKAAEQQAEAKSRPQSELPAQEGRAGPPQWRARVLQSPLEESMPDADNVCPTCLRPRRGQRPAAALSELAVALAICQLLRRCCSCWRRVVAEALDANRGRACYALWCPCTVTISCGQEPGVDVGAGGCGVEPGCPRDYDQPGHRQVGDEDVALDRQVLPRRQDAVFQDHAGASGACGRRAR